MLRLSAGGPVCVNGRVMSASGEHVNRRVVSASGERVNGRVVSAYGMGHLMHSRPSKSWKLLETNTSLAVQNSTHLLIILSI